MRAYLDIVDRVLSNGELKENRTGVGTIAVAGAMFEHDMSEGFPLLTTKFVPYRLVSSELEFFVKGITDKGWLRDRNNHIWDEWCNPEKVAYGHDDETRDKMAAERDLGPVYGFGWRHFGAGKDYVGIEGTEDSLGNVISYNGQGADQLKNVVDKLESDPSDRRMIVSAWDPNALSKQALPPCHYGFQVTVIGDKLNLLWNQRSVDTALGLPFNIASYGTLLHLLAKESGFKEGKLIGFLGDTHVYENHVDGLKKQLGREPKGLPSVETDNFSSIFDWKFDDTRIEGYEHHPGIRFDIAV